MPFDEILAERIRQRLARRKNIEEKKMFGGVGFLLNGNMLVWVLVEPEGVEDDDQLSGWIRRAVKFVGALPAKEK